MKLHASASLALLLALAAGQAVAAGARPLQLGFAPPAARAAGAEHARLPLAAHPANPASFRPAPRLAPASSPKPARQFGRNAVQSILAEPEPSFEAANPDGRLNLKFQKRGHALRNVQQGYREMCDRVSAKIWDEPNGKRVRFDVAGRPGFGVEIPLGRAQPR